MFYTWDRVKAWGRRIERRLAALATQGQRMEERIMGAIEELTDKVDALETKLTAQSAIIAEAKVTLKELGDIVKSGQASEEKLHQLATRINAASEKIDEDTIGLKAAETEVDPTPDEQPPA